MLQPFLIIWVFLMQIRLAGLGCFSGLSCSTDRSFYASVTCWGWVQASSKLSIGDRIQYQSVPLSGYSLRKLFVFEAFPTNWISCWKEVFAFWDSLKEFLSIKIWEGWESNVVGESISVLQGRKEGWLLGNLVKHGLPEKYGKFEWCYQEAVPLHIMRTGVTF